VSKSFKDMTHSISLVKQSQYIFTVLNFSWNGFHLFHNRSKEKKILEALSSVLPLTGNILHMYNACHVLRKWKCREENSERRKGGRGLLKKSTILSQ
jgi:hypothetical protein